MSKKWEKCENCGTSINYGENYGSIRFSSSLALTGWVEEVFCDSCTEEIGSMVVYGELHKIYPRGKVTSSTIHRGKTKP